MGVRFQLDPAAETRLDLAATATVVCLAVAAHPIVRIVVRARFVIVSAVVAVAPAVVSAAGVVFLVSYCSRQAPIAI